MANRMIRFLLALGNTPIRNLATPLWFAAWLLNPRQLHGAYRGLRALGGYGPLEAVRVTLAVTTGAMWRILRCAVYDHVFAPDGRCATCRVSREKLSCS